jgi:hypothetical protein
MTKFHSNTELEEYLCVLHWPPGYTRQGMIQIRDRHQIELIQNSDRTTRIHFENAIETY